MAVLAPMPSASIVIATIVKPGDLRSVRTPYCTSWTNRSNHLQPHISRISSFT